MIEGIAPGLLPEYEEREAARFNGYRWTEWCALPRGERIHGVGYYRVHLLVGIHVDEKSAQEMRRQAATS